MPSAMHLFPAIKIDGAEFKTKDKIHWYEGEVLGVLNMIDASTTGRICFRYIQSIKAGRGVTIKPYTWSYITKTWSKPSDRVNNLWNATAESTDDTKEDDMGQSVIVDALNGPSRGADALVYFTKWVIESRKYRKLAGIPKNGAGSLPDEILLHELIHATASMLGREDSSKTGDKMDFVTEFRSIMVTNIYATDPSNKNKGRPVRADHWGSTTFSGTTGDLNRDFLKIGSYRNYTKAFIRRFPGLALQLAAVNSAFNPIRVTIEDAANGKG
jgi:hypothetical protein